MSLKIVVEIKPLAERDFQAIVRVLRYEDALVDGLKSLLKREELIEFEKATAEKAKTLAEFTILTLQTKKRGRSKSWIAEDIEREAKNEVLKLCREIITNLEQETKLNPRPSHG